MFKRKEYLTSGDSRKAYAAQCMNKIEWNKYIGGEISNKLHEKLLPYHSGYVLPFKDILPLLEAGYLGTVKEMTESFNPEIDELKDIQKWLLESITEADELS